MLFPKEAKRYKYIAYGESQFALNKKNSFPIKKFQISE